MYLTPRFSLPEPERTQIYSNKACTRKPRPCDRGSLFANKSVCLCHYFCDDACSHRLSSLEDSETHFLFERDRPDELHFEGDRVARHDHFHAFFERYLTRYVRC